MPVESPADIAGMFDPADHAESAIYRSPDGTAFPCGVIRHEPDPILDMGAHHVRREGWVFMIPIHQVPKPEKGGQLEIARGTEPWGVFPWHGQRAVFDVQLEPHFGYHFVSVR